MFRTLKSNADRLAADAAWSRQARNAHARRGYEILRRRIASPPALIACFGAGVFAGARSRKREIHDDGEHRAHDRSLERERAKGGLTHWLLHGPLGGAVIKFGMAYLAGALIHPDPEPPPPPI